MILLFVPRSLSFPRTFLGLSGGRERARTSPFLLPRDQEGDGENARRELHTLRQERRYGEREGELVLQEEIKIRRLVLPEEEGAILDMDDRVDDILEEGATHVGN